MVKYERNYRAPEGGVSECDLTRALQAIPLQNSGGVAQAWQTKNGEWSTEILSSSIGFVNKILNKIDLHNFTQGRITMVQHFLELSHKKQAIATKSEYMKKYSILIEQ